MAESSGIESRVVVITGANGNLGRVVAERFAERGARLALFGLGAEPLEKLATRLGLAEDRYPVASTEFTDADAVQKAVASVVDRFGRVDVLLHLIGGYAGDRPVLDVPAREVSGMLRQQVWTTFHAVQAFVPHMVENGWGRIMVLSQPVCFRREETTTPTPSARAGRSCWRSRWQRSSRARGARPT